MPSFTMETGAPHEIFRRQVRPRKQVRYWAFASVAPAQIVPV
jgi:hypothetical protein